MTFCKEILQFNIAKARESEDTQKYRSSLLNLEKILNEEKRVMEEFK